MNSTPSSIPLRPTPFREPPMRVVTPVASAVASTTASTATMTARISAGAIALSSVESEKSLICAALTESRQDLIAEISRKLTANDFHELSHQNIWRCRTSLSDAGVAYDFLSILAAAKRLDLFIGGSEYVMGLIQDDVLKSNSDTALKASAKRVKDFSTRRMLLDTLDTAKNKLSNNEKSSNDEVINYVTESLESIRRAAETAQSGPLPVMFFVNAVLEQVYLRLEGIEPDNVVTSGSQTIDRLTGGFSDGDLILLAARPSMGKTAVCLHMMQAAAKEGKRHVIIFTTEQGGNALATRMIASTGRINSMNIRKGNLTDDELNRLAEGAREVGEMTMFLDETSEINLNEIKTKARQFASKFGKEKIIIAVDYIQRLMPHRVAEKNVIVGEISTGLKNLAKELGCPVVALAQLNREVDKRANKRPMLSDLGDSGQLERDADIVVFIYRDEYYDANTKDLGITELIVAKCKDGAVGTVKMASDKTTQRYQDLDCAV